MILVLHWTWYIACVRACVLIKVYIDSYMSIWNTMEYNTYYQSVVLYMRIYSNVIHYANNKVHVYLFAVSP